MKWFRERLYLKDRLRKPDLEPSKIWTLKKIRSQKSKLRYSSQWNRRKIQKYVMSWEPKEETVLRRRKWWPFMVNAKKELNYMRTKNYFGILFDLDKNYFSWNGSDKRSIDKDWTKTDNLMFLILGIYLIDIFALRKNTVCSKLLPAVFL